MKKILILLTACLICSVAYSVGENCYQINNIDSKNYCLATAKQEKSYCYQINDADRKNMCLAQAGREKSYCYQINNTDTKNQCLGQF
jgi:uncharacterized protein YxeA